MNKFYLCFLVLVFGISSCREQINFDRSKPIVELHYAKDYTPTYEEIITHYETLDRFSSKCKLIEVGTTDIGRPLHLFVLSNSEKFTPEEARAEGKAVVFINNGIHPGEPCGIDASLKFADELIRDVDGISSLLNDVTLCIVPVYNIGGCLNRSAFNRANSFGPTESGFRGNAKNLDLNRDFLKCDSKNAESFSKLFTLWNPDLFLDTHTTNGSDHQYSITLIPTCTSGLPKSMSDFQRTKLLPALYDGMKRTPYEMTPYVIWNGKQPEDGIQMFVESPRYSTGYSRLHQSYGFMTENHVYKSYTDRVESVFHFMKLLLRFGAENKEEILESRQRAQQELIKDTSYALDYKVDTTAYEWFSFKGYRSGISKSPVTGLQRFTYDTTKAFEEPIKYYSTHIPSDIVTKPKAYVIPQAWDKVVDRLQWNGVRLQRLKTDTTIAVNCYYLKDRSTSTRPSSGHFFHYKIATEVQTQNVQFYKGDYLVFTNQNKISYIMESLEPKAKDSFFRWNFFDSILEKREYFSPWGFEKNAQNYLDSHPEFKEKWEHDRKEFATHKEQMNLLYNSSEWYELSYLRYPVYRIEF